MEVGGTSRETATADPTPSASNKRQNFYSILVSKRFSCTFCKTVSTKINLLLHEILLYLTPEQPMFSHVLWCGPPICIGSQKYFVKWDAHIRKFVLFLKESIYHKHIKVFWKRNLTNIRNTKLPVKKKLIYFELSRFTLRYVNQPKQFLKK